MTLHIKEIQNITTPKETISTLEYDVCVHAKNNSGCESWRNKNMFEKYCKDNSYLCPKHGVLK